MEPRKASPAKDGPFGFMSEERVDDDIMKEEKAFFGAVRPDEPLIEYAPVQSTDQVLLISPTAFGYNPEAAKDNRFMHAVDEGELEIVRRKVMREHENLVDLLGNQKGPLQMTVHLFDHKESHGTPDAVFPNNWFSTAPDVLNFYPMKNENRRKERRKDLVTYLDRMSKCTIDLTYEEETDPPRFLEGTGSLVLDRVNRVAYVAISERSDKGLAEHWGKLNKYEVVSFDAKDRNGDPIYHTNVMMSIGTEAALVCKDSLSTEDWEKVSSSLTNTGRVIVEITMEQMECFACNCLEVRNWKFFPALVMSTRAYRSLREDQLEVLREHFDGIYHVDLTTIEDVGGGSVRCCIAELFDGFHIVDKQGVVRDIEIKGLKSVM